jgi:hypothetical protein
MSLPFQKRSKRDAEIIELLIAPTVGTDSSDKIEFDDVLKTYKECFTRLQTVTCKEDIDDAFSCVDPNRPIKFDMEMVYAKHYLDYIGQALDSDIYKKTRMYQNTLHKF